ncbi:conserved hypothetical protein [Neospora caninum Liverpool]|uniref:Uncharacterized protein n=1 Tax=Neospora caninum (strain Liverpool) TaxID=572307 RepID=F0V7K2_NEOCL|nr:conserved hypothetical protein [Neospora caninum Liverpool]CBZ49693.1 conserved hypothetical protein [Neospora caninum Liverpool]CEL64278.1 TPA: hypothetical protein BN1204_001810 [Neospora caninum Liverpool]|eukprot:XP_003879728.1 conserved hypothetical protein [Neospora caninum Liverpool]
MLTNLIFAVETHNAEKQLECSRTIEALEEDLVDIRKDFLAVHAGLGFCTQFWSLVRTVFSSSISAPVLADAEREDFDSASTVLSSMTIDSLIHRRSSAPRRNKVQPKKKETKEEKEGKSDTRASVQAPSGRGESADAETDTEGEESGETEEIEEEGEEIKEEGEESEEEGEESEEDGEESDEDGEESDEDGEASEEREEAASDEDGSAAGERALLTEAEEARRLVRLSSCSSLSSVAVSEVEEDSIVKEALRERRELCASEPSGISKERANEKHRRTEATTWRGTLMEGALWGHRFEQLQKRKLINSAKVLQQ